MSDKTNLNGQSVTILVDDFYADGGRTCNVGTDSNTKVITIGNANSVTSIIGATTGRTWTYKTDGTVSLNGVQIVSNLKYAFMQINGIIWIKIGNILTFNTTATGAQAILINLPSCLFPYDDTTIVSASSGFYVTLNMTNAGANTVQNALVTSLSNAATTAGYTFTTASINSGVALAVSEVVLSYPYTH